MAQSSPRFANEKYLNLRQGQSAPINITTREIFTNNKRLEQEQRQRRQALIDQQRQINQREQAIIANERSCPVTQIKSLRPYLGKLDPQQYRNIMKEYFYDPAVMATMACVADSIFYMGPDNSNNVSPYERIKNFIRNLRQIGAESVDGYALKGNLINAKNVFIVKAPREQNNNELLHEYFIGTYGLNQLRKLVPNFAYILGSFACSPPAIAQDKDVVAWCNNGTSPVSYVLYENIEPSLSLRDYIKQGCTFQQWLNIYMQILYSLQVAWEVTDFTHYDLHDENVLVRQINQGTVLIPYQDDKKTTIYLQAEGVATVIDYGISHIKYRGENFGVDDRIPWGVRSDRSFPMHDAYKLLMWSMRSAYESNRSIFKDMSKIFRFFNQTDNPDIVVQEQRQTYFYIPGTPQLLKLTHFDLINYIKKKVKTPFILIHPNQYPILGCSGMVCPSKENTIRNIGMIGELQANSVFEFYDLVSNLQKQGRTEEIEEIFDSFDYVKAMNVAVNQYDTSIRSLNKFNTTVVYQINNLSPQGLLSENTYHQFRRYVTSVVKAYEDYQDAILLADAMMYTGQYHNDTSFVEALQENSGKLLQRYNDRFLAIVVPRLQQEIKYIQQLYRNNRQFFQERFKSNSRYVWYVTTLPSYLSILPQGIS